MTTWWESFSAIKPDWLAPFNLTTRVRALGESACITPRPQPQLDRGISLWAWRRDRMRERENERTIERNNERTKERKNERTKERKNERMKNEKMWEWKNEKMWEWKSESLKYEIPIPDQGCKARQQELKHHDCLIKSNIPFAHVSRHNSFKQD